MTNRPEGAGAQFSFEPVIHGSVPTETFRAAAETKVDQSEIPTQSGSQHRVPRLTDSSRGGSRSMRITPERWVRVKTQARIVANSISLG